MVNHTPLVADPHNIRLAMLGMVEGNGHPYSWSAIVNGRYDADVMAKCGYPVIAQYLGAQPKENLGIPGAQVTHVWCDQRTDAEQVARAAYIDHIVDKPEDVIGHVDAVIIATDVGHEHLDRARPFIEADLPVFIDKPLTDREDHLRQFHAWWQQGKAILSTSCMRYATEFAQLREQLPATGTPRLIFATMLKDWERYGIHGLESIYGLLPPGGWQRVVNTGTPELNIVHLTHEAGVDIVLAVGHDLVGGYGHVSVIGSKATVRAEFRDTFAAFKAQLVAFVDYLRCGVSPVPQTETIEQMKIIIAGIRSREQHGKPIYLSEIQP
ncbi:Gfo/Idh/MocA family oxidoreductase [Phycisphaerales bacterium AB-hyl4]|uniref:Gfo/Idh/MocA family oxidoreductase n=1 Tax=Natronomicrosphaera hydrolytica TaxID=3242702 RepID=A0ABV4U6K3_9BACT